MTGKLFPLGLLALISLLTFAGGFVAEPGSLFFKFDWVTQDADEYYTVDGDSATLNSLLGVNEVAETNYNLYLGLGITERFSMSLSMQYQDAEVITPGDSLTNDGFTDAWLAGQYLLYRNQWNLVLNVGAKIPLESNEATLPQLTSGEPYYDLGLGAGYGGNSFYFEGDVFYRFQTGETRSPVPFVDGVPYEDQWGLVAKGGVSLSPRFSLEGLLNYGATTADLEASQNVEFGNGVLDLEDGGLYANDDRFTVQLSGYFYIVPGKTGVGAGFTRFIDGNNVIDFDNTLTLSFFQKWSDLF